VICRSVTEMEKLKTRSLFSDPPSHLRLVVIHRSPKSLSNCGSQRIIVNNALGFVRSVVRASRPESTS
jgi:hypothetical protein